MNERRSNFELLRVVCMLFIVAGHIIAAHGSEKNFSNSDWLIDMTLRGFFSVAVNAFILISGYWSIKLRQERLLKLEFQILFYSIGLFLLMSLLGVHPLSPINDFKFFLPSTCNLYWFMTNYVILCLLSPFFNQFVNSMSRIQFRNLLIIAFVIVYVWPTFCFLVNANQFIGDSGYGIINFSYLYLLGRYLRVYYDIRRSAIFYLCGFVASCALLSICQLGLSYLLGFEFTSFYSYNSVFMLIGALMLFLAFSRMIFSSAIINKLAAPCLSVYLIHQHPLVFNWGGAIF